MRAEIISVGTELLLGDIVNTNAQYLAQEMASLGYSVYYQTVVGDNPTRLRNLVLDAKARSEVLVFTGGLGPTEDDLTKEVVAEAFGDTLTLDVDELVRLEQFFNSFGREMPPNNRKQAMVPVRGHKLLNPHGTAPGAFFRQGNKFAFLLPGPPREMKLMFEEQVRPLLEAMQDSVIRSKTLRVFGIGESDLETKVISLLDSSNPTAALYAKPGEVHVRITAKAANAELADEMCEQYAELFRKILGNTIYSESEDGLESAVVKLLAKAGATVATAESCTGGMLSQRITSVSGASSVYRYGFVTYANEAKHRLLGVRRSTLRKHGAVSSQAAAEMAFGTLAKSKDTYSIAITGIAGPNGTTDEKPVGLVYIALASENKVYVRRISMKGRGREMVRQMACHNALDMLRRAMLGLEIQSAKVFTKQQEADYDREGKPRRRRSPVSRMAAVLILVVLLLAMMVAGIYFSGQGGSRDDGQDSLPQTQGHSYGSEEYSSAARNYLLQAQATNPAVMGFVALENGMVEAVVTQSATASQHELAEVIQDPGIRGNAVIAAEALPTRAAANTVVLGGDNFSALFQLPQMGAEQQPTTFTYYTDSEELVYQVFALYMVDKTEPEPQAFDPLTGRFVDYSGFITYITGVQVRSMIETDAELGEDDTYMSLAVQDPTVAGRYLYLCGRLMDEEQEPVHAVQLAANPLMPATWYLEQGTAQPTLLSLYVGNLRDFLTGGVTNSMLQLQVGMPEQDAMPLVQPPEMPSPLQESEDDQSLSQSAEAESDVQSGDSAASSDSEDASSSASSLQEESASSAQSDSSSEVASSDSSVLQEEESSSVAASSSEPQVYVPPTPSAQRPDPDYLTVTMNGQIVTDTTQNILAQICQAEAPNAATATIKALAVAAHSWILNLQGAGVTAPPVVGQTPSPSVLEAVGEVANFMLSDDAENPAFTTFYNMAAFGTNDAQQVWGAYRPYLTQVESAYERDMDGWRKIIEIPQQQVAELLERQLGISFGEDVEPGAWFTDVVIDDSGYVTSLMIGTRQTSGYELWQQVLVQDGESILPSPAFEVSFNGEDFVFITYGEGHGCGLSIAGANSYAREGWTYAEILANYFPGTELVAL